jgi:hypothetical protein
VIAIRPAEPGDVQYLRRTWIDSFADYDHTGRARSVIPRQLKPSVYRETWGGVVAEILGRSTCLVAFDPEYSSVIIGWLVFEQLPRHLPVVHYAYTRHRARRTGVLRQLLTEAGLYEQPVAYSHRTIDAQRITQGWERTWPVPPEYNFTLALWRHHEPTQAAA